MLFDDSATMKRLLTYTILLLLFACGQTTDNNKPSGLFPIKEFGKWGYINSDGQTIIKCQFDAAGQFSEGLAAILIDSVWGFIDTSGKIIIEPNYYRVAQFSDGLCNVTIQKDTIFQNAFIRTDGSIAFVSNYRNISPFAFGRATVEINDEVCIIDTLGKIVFNTHYPYGGGSPLQDGIVQVWGGTAGWVQEGLSNVWRGDTTRYYDKDGNLLLEMEGMGFSNFNNGLALVQINDKACFINKKGEIKIKPERPELTYFDFSDGLAQVVIAGSNHKAGFIDTTGKIVIPIQYHNIRDFKEGLAAFREKDTWGFIDKTGKVVIKPQFEQIEYGGFTNGLCRAKQNHQWGYINKKGEFVWKEQVGLEYTKLDLSKWNLDTLEINKPLYADKYAGIDNYPRKQTFASLNQLTLKVDTEDLTVFADKYLAFKLYLINASKDTVNVPAQDGRIEIIQQAINKNGEWQDIDNFINSFCGNSYHTLQLAPNEFQIFATPIFKGQFKTQLRFKLEIDKQIIYSNTYLGLINYGQLLNPNEKDKTGIAVWTN